ncbi:MAG: flagellin, partial [Christensenellales bacterium]
MRINNNIMALNTHRQYAINNENMAKATSRLSSGYRINNAADDAAGLAISEKMRAQIRGLNMAAKNSQDAISLVQTAEGALEETEAILQRMRELAVQAASDTNQEIDRNALDAEFQQLIKEIDDIANKADFNGTKLLDGSLSTVSFVGDATGDALTLKEGMTLNGFENLAKATEYGFAFTPEVTTSGSEAPAYLTIVSGSNKYYIESKGAGAAFEAGEYQVMVGDPGSGTEESGVTITLSAEAATVLTDSVDLTTLKFDLNPDAPIVIQTGSNKGDTLAISIGDMSSEGLNVKTASIATRENASSAISTVGDAINAVSTQRASLGAMQNRLEHKINNLETSAENLQSAESRIRD